MELLLCIPFSTAIGESSSIHRIVTDWRSKLGQQLISVALHFSSRKGALKDKAIRDRIVDKAANTFVKGIGVASAADDIATLTKIRVNLLQKGLEADECKSYYNPTPIGNECVVVDDEGR